MKIVTFLLGALLAAALGAAAFFYFTVFTPMSADYERMKAGMPELDKAKAEMKKCKDKEAKQAAETAWLAPAVAALNADLANEIKDSKAEVISTENAVVVNITASALYTPESKTFAKDTQTRSKLVAMLRRDELKGKDIFIGNITDAAVARGKGRKKVPAKDALTLASERSAEMVKYLVKNGVPQDSVAALAYSAKTLDRGFKIKSGKTMIIIGVYPAPAAQTAAAPAAQQKPVPAVQQKPAPAAQQKPAVQPAAGAPQQPQPKTIPIKPAQPKTN